MSGICGLLFVLFNAVFCLVLLIMVLISSVYAIFSKNPDTRYQPMRDDRGSFIKSQSNLNTELDALAVTARGDMKQKRDLDDDSDSFTSAAISHQHQDPSQVPLPVSAAASSRNVNTYGQPSASPINPSTPFIPNNGGPRHGTPASYDRPTYSSGGYSNNGYTRAANNASPVNYSQGGYNGYGYDRSGSLRSDTSYRGAAGGNQWQRGAGYDH